MIASKHFGAIKFHQPPVAKAELLLIACQLFLQRRYGSTLRSQPNPRIQRTFVLWYLNCVPDGVAHPLSVNREGTVATEINTMQRLGLLLLLLCTTSVTQAGIIRHDTADSLYTDLAADPAFSSVGKVDFTLRGFDFNCSGVAIEPRWVLTAGHCLNDGAGGFATRFEFSVGGSTYFGERLFTTFEWNVGLGLAFEFDLGLVRVSEEITGVSFARLYDGFDELGNIGTFVGFGATGDGLTGAVQPLGTKRAGRNVLDAHDTSMSSPEKTLLVDFDNPDDASASTLGDSSPLALEYSLAGGDSGGGVFIEEAGELYLAGINAYVYTPPPGYGQRAGAVRVSEHLDFIDDVIFFNSVQSAVPMPAPLALLPIGWIFFFRDRLRFR